MFKYDPEQITFFAKTDARGQEVPFGIKAKDRTRHVYVIGKTGMGKSTLLENMAAQDIKNGNGLAFIDPHGQTAELLLSYIPEERIKDVLYFAPFDTDYPVSFNVMEDVGPDRRHLVVSGLMSVFKKIWVDAWSARMEYILSNTLLALLEYPGSTLLGVNRMLSDKVYRRKVIDNITDPAVKSFWVDEFLNYNERYMQEAGDAIKNKIGQFTSNPLIRNIVGQPKSSFDIRKIMDERKILIVNLSKGLVGESNANLLGSMLTTRIYLAAMSRANLTPDQMKEMPNFYFFVDEFQSFANATFADILSEARKYKLNLTIAHQYIEQMEEEVRNAVFGNVGTTIAFRVGPFDAEVLESIFTPKFLAPDIVNLGFAQIYLTLMIDGIGSQPFSAVTLPPIEAPRISHREAVIENSRRNFAHPRAGVEAIINAWHHDKGELPVKENKEPKTTTNSTPALRSEGERPKRDFPPKNGNSNGNGGNHGGSQNGNSANGAPPKKREFSQNDNSKRSRPEANGQPDSRSNRAADAQPKPKTAEDLRAVLRTIATNSAADNDKSEGKNQPDPKAAPLPQKTQQSAPEPVKKTEVTSADKSDLKSALAAALAAASRPQAKDSAHQPNLQTPPVPQSVSNPPATTAPINAPESPVLAAEVAETKAPPTHFPKIEDPLSPKKLERMMRITGNDKTPLA